jgi:hypothetical protein
MATSAQVPPASGWVPSRKVIGGFILGLVTIVGHAIASGGFDSTEWAEVLTLLSTVVTAYFVTNAPNDPTEPSNIAAFTSGSAAVDNPDAPAAA